MRIKKRIVLIVIGLLALTACAKSQGEKDISGQNRMIAYYRDKKTTISLKGGLNVVDYKIKYQDFATDTTIYLCNKEGCAHRDKECDANLFDIQASTAFFYKDQVYVIGLPQLEGFQLWKMNMDGTSRKKLIEIMDGQFLEDLFLKDNKLFYSATKLVLDEDKSEQIGENEGYGVLTVIDLDTNQATTLWDGREGRYEIEKMIVRDDGVYCLVNQKSEDYKEIGNRIWSDTTMTEDEKVMMLIEEQGKCKLVQKVYYLAADSTEPIEKYTHSTICSKPALLCGVDAKGILMMSENEYYYVGDENNKIYQNLDNITVIDNGVLAYDGQNSEIVIYDELGEKIITRVNIDPPKDYFEVETTMEANNEFDELIPEYNPAEPEKREWFLTSPFYTDGENLFFDFVAGSGASIWVLKVSELVEGKCIWHRGI